MHVEASTARPRTADARRNEMRFLAQAASRIAAGFAANGETSGQDPRRIARDAFAIAIAILDCANQWVEEEATEP